MLLRKQGSEKREMSTVYEGTVQHVSKTYFQPRFENRMRKRDDDDDARNGRTAKCKVAETNGNGRLLRVRRSSCLQHSPHPGRAFVSKHIFYSLFERYIKCGKGGVVKERERERERDGERAKEESGKQNILQKKNERKNQNLFIIL